MGRPWRISTTFWISFRPPYVKPFFYKGNYERGIAKIKFVALATPIGTFRLEVEHY